MDFDDQGVIEAMGETDEMLPNGISTASAPPRLSQQEEGSSQPMLVVVGSDHVDAEGYAGLYTGRTWVARLLFIAGRCGAKAVQLEALRMAYEELKKGEDSHLFHEVVDTHLTLNF